MSLENIIRSNCYEKFYKYCKKKKVDFYILTGYFKTYNKSNNEVMLFLIKMVEADAQLKKKFKLKNLSKTCFDDNSECLKLLKLFFKKKGIEQNIRIIGKFFLKSKKGSILNLCTNLKNVTLPILKSFVEKKFIDGIRLSLQAYENIADIDIIPIVFENKKEILKRIIQFKNIYSLKILELMKIPKISIYEYNDYSYEKKIGYYLLFCSKIENIIIEIETELAQYHNTRFKINSEILRLNNHGDDDTESLFSEYLFDSEDASTFETLDSIENINSFDDFDKDINIKMVVRKKDHIYTNFSYRYQLKEYVSHIIDSVLQKIDFI
jgi:hypothetical protein